MSERPDASGQTFTTPQGSLRIWLPAPFIIAIQFKGHLTAGFARQIMAAINRQLAEKTSVATFLDWFEMDNYDTEARVEMTKWALKIKEQLKSIHILVRSKLVSMGVSVANLALGGILTSYSDRAAYARALQAASAAPPAGNGDRSRPPT